MTGSATFSDSIRCVMRKAKWTQAALAEADGVRCSAVQAMCSSKGNPSVRVLSRRLAIMGYRVALVPEDAELPDGCIVVKPCDYD